MVLISDWEGRLIGGRYELREYIAKGGMGHVFKAWDYMAKRLVAVKIASRVKPSAESGFSKALDVWLKREIGALKSLLDHPQVVQMLDFGVDEDLHYIILEYVDGKDLGGLIASQGEPLSVDACAAKILQLLDALDAMFKVGIIHRDIKPSNIMEDSSGNIKLIDFGLVKLASEIVAEEDSGLSRGSVIGTPYYLSPEQVRDDPGLDWRSDLCNVGMVMYELLTGKSPFRNSNTRSLCVYAWEAPLRPFPKYLRIPRKIQAVVWKALSVDREDRYQTAKEMKLALIEAMQPFSFKGWVKGIWVRIRSRVPFLR